ncbi:MAG: hypothetical protein EXS38_02305 [Opitutus sp.]|nr:hypothetical protein [Opitutus sp.]
MADSTYLVFNPVEDYGKFDQMMADHAATLKGMNAAEKTELDKYGEMVSRLETNRYRLDPVQSYVAKEVRAQEPEFWSPK